MKITTLRDAIAEMEHGKVQVNIAQIAEVLKCINTLTQGDFYKNIRASNPLLPSNLTKGR